MANSLLGVIKEFSRLIKGYFNSKTIPSGILRRYVWHCTCFCQKHKQQIYLNKSQEIKEYVDEIKTCFEVRKMGKRRKKIKAIHSTENSQNNLIFREVTELSNFSNACSVKG